MTTPQSKLVETPRTDAAWDAEWQAKALDPNADPAHGMCDFAMELERELAQAQARCAELENDAARYRWLREYCKTPYDQRCITLLGDTLDEAVDDAALKEPR